MSSIGLVPGTGRLPSDLMFVGEAPGEVEFRTGKPFTGPSGQELEWYLSKYGLSSYRFYRTNVSKLYQEGNPDPTPELIESFTAELLDEVFACQPKIIVCVGRFAAKFFLGESVHLDDIHGIPYSAGWFDSSRINRAPKNCIIIATYHPAYGMRQDRFIPDILDDFGVVAKCYEMICRGRRDKIKLGPPEDEYPNPQYASVSGESLAATIEQLPEFHDTKKQLWIGLDTEGVPGEEESIQPSFAPGTGLTLWTPTADFELGIHYLQLLVNRPNVTVCMHQASTPDYAMYDVVMCRGMGLDLSRANIWDTMYGEFLLNTVTRGLKPLSYRKHGAIMDDYMSLVEGVARERQIEYLKKVAKSTWPKSEHIFKRKNDGTFSVTKPKIISTIAAGILRDIESGKTDKDGNLTDPYKRWKKADIRQVKIVEQKLGKMPKAKLSDLPIEKATRYASMDADFTLRNGLRQRRIFNQPGYEKKLELMLNGMEFLKIVEKIQRNGLHVSISYFESLLDEYNSRLDAQVELISTHFNNGKPFNPGSTKQVSKLMDNLGIEETKRSKKTGLRFTDKKNLKYVSAPVLDEIGKWRPIQHLRDAFVEPILEKAYEARDRLILEKGPEASKEDLVNITCTIRPAGIPTRRLAAANPNFLNLPSRTEEGTRIREGFFAPPEEVLVSCDLSQVEARFLAHETRDALLLDIFLNDRDMHTETARRLNETTQETKEQRKGAKTINFGIINGMSELRLQEELQLQGIYWSAEQCKQSMEKWHQTFKGVTRYRYELTKEVKRKGYVEDAWGMTRRLPTISHYRRKISAEAERQAINHKIQGGAQGMIQNAQRELERKFEELLVGTGIKVDWRLQVHDELIVSCLPQYAEFVKSLVIGELINSAGIKLAVPILANGKIGTNWGKLE